MKKGLMKLLFVAVCVASCWTASAASLKIPDLIHEIEQRSQMTELQRMETRLSDVQKEIKAVQRMIEQTPNKGVMKRLNETLEQNLAAFTQTQNKLKSQISTYKKNIVANNETKISKARDELRAIQSEIDTINRQLAKNPPKFMRKALVEVVSKLTQRRNELDTKITAYTKEIFVAVKLPKPYMPIVKLPMPSIDAIAKPMPMPIFYEAKPAPLKFEYPIAADIVPDMRDNVIGGGGWERINKLIVNPVDAALVNQLVDNVREVVGNDRVKIGDKINEITKQIEQIIPDGNTQQVVKETVKSVIDGKPGDVDIGAAMGVAVVEQIKHAISHNLGQAEANAINEAIDGYIAAGSKGVDAAVEKELNRLIDTYVKGDDARAALKDTLEKARNDQWKNIDAKDVAEKVVLGGVADWISRQDWTENQKKAALEAVSGFAANGIDGMTEAGLAALQKKVAGIVGEEKAGALVGEVGNLVKGAEANWGTIGSVLDDIGKQMTIDSIEKWIDKHDWTDDQKRRAKAAVEGLVTDGVSGLTEAGKAALNEKLTEIVGADKAGAFMGEVDNLLNGNNVNWTTVGDVVGDVGTKLAVDGINKWIDKQDWTDEQKARAKAAVTEFAENGLDGLTDMAKEMLQAKLTKIVGEEKAAEFMKQCDNFLSGNPVNWEEVGDVVGGVVGSIAKEVFGKAIDKQIEKLVQKYPSLKNLFEALGISGDNIVGIASDIWGILSGEGSIAQKLTALTKYVSDGLNKIISNLKDYFMGKMKQFLNQVTKKLTALINKVIAKIREVVARVKGFVNDLHCKVQKIKEKVKYIVEKVQETKGQIQEIINKAKQFRKAINTRNGEIQK